MLKAGLAEGLNYTNFPKLKYNRGEVEQNLKYLLEILDFRNKPVKSCLYLDDFLINTVNPADIHSQ